jgi:hypothetical protein
VPQHNFSSLFKEACSFGFLLHPLFSDYLIHGQSPGNAFFLVSNLVPAIERFKVYIVGNPSVWIRAADIFEYGNAPSISSVIPNFVLCSRSPILVTPDSNQTVTHTCDEFDISVNGCGYDQSVTIDSFCSFFGDRKRQDGSASWNPPYSRGSVTSNQQIKCTSPKGSSSLKDCTALQNSSFPIGPRNFGISQIRKGLGSNVMCELNEVAWFPLSGDSQVTFTFFDDPAFLKLGFLKDSAVNTSYESSESLSLEMLRVSNSVTL